MKINRGITYPSESITRDFLRRDASPAGTNQMLSLSSHLAYMLREVREKKIKTFNEDGTDGCVFVADWDLNGLISREMSESLFTIIMIVY